MSVHEQLADLKKQHQELSATIEVEQNNPGADHFAITELKKKKLQIKEQIHRLSEA